MALKIKDYDYREHIGRNASGTETETEGSVPETRYLYNGKIYRMEYYEKSERLTDTHPVIISLGAAGNGMHYFYGVNFHYIPKQMRAAVLELIYAPFATLIGKEIEKYPSKEDAPKQMPLEKLTRDAIVTFATKVNIIGAIHKYYIKDIRNAVTLNYNQMHVLVNDDGAEFNNGTVNDAVKIFLSTIKR